MHTSFFTRLAALAALASVVVALPSDCTRKITIKAGETCATISATHEVSTYQLMKVNTGIINTACDLHVGEELCLGIKDKDCVDIHVVKTHEDCTEIAKEAGIPLSTLYANNPNVKKGCSNLYANEVLCTSKQIYSY
ncbi:uncharacterized protein EDB91DRAFT_1157120 [Suillus paluster]|uniref:uncharacterized protein n=1 Tax=Suillus paluster TaxID=48578 RepID=UPI001B865353|nr:uncharacterized protein EDB91DRAFT_1157120 [Suillus paluster]KAG1730365.1 hypothetical protein EDB91DRAFT_1157120 [Suillus paluster]